jgi:hypothetical protein
MFQSMIQKKLERQYNSIFYILKIELYYIEWFFLIEETSQYLFENIEILYSTERTYSSLGYLS